MSKTRELLAIVSRGLLIALILTVVLLLASVGAWVGKVSVGYFVTSTDAFFGAPKP